MPLFLGAEHQPYRIVRIGGRDEARTRLQALGLSEQSIVTIVQATGTSLIVESRGVRMALGAELARRIQIQPV